VPAGSLDLCHIAAAIVDCCGSSGSHAVYLLLCIPCVFAAANACGDAVQYHVIRTASSCGHTSFCQYTSVASNYSIIVVCRSAPRPNVCTTVIVPRFHFSSVAFRHFNTTLPAGLAVTPTYVPNMVFKKFQATTTTKVGCWHSLCQLACISLIVDSSHPARLLTSQPATEPAAASQLPTSQPAASQSAAASQLARLLTCLPASQPAFVFVFGKPANIGGGTSCREDFI